MLLICFDFQNESFPSQNFAPGFVVSVFSFLNLFQCLKRCFFKMFSAKNFYSNSFSSNMIISCWIWCFWCFNSIFNDEATSEHWINIWYCLSLFSWCIWCPRRNNLWDIDDPVIISHAFLYLYFIFINFCFLFSIYFFMFNFLSLNT